MFNAISLTDRNLVLTGYTGANQPRTAQAIAERLGMPFVNLDLLISERAGLSATDDLRAQFGQRHLRAVESDIIEEARLRRQTVIRVNARTLLHGTHLTALGQTGPVVALITTLDAVLRRMHVSLGGRYADPNERARELGELRQEWGIRNLDGLARIDTTHLTNEQVIDTVVALYRERAISRD